MHLIPDDKDTIDREMMLEEIERLTIKLDNAVAVIDVVRVFVQAGKDRKARTKAFQVAASIARKGGAKGNNVIKEVERKHPIVVDIGDAFDAIETALDNYDQK